MKIILRIVLILLIASVVAGAFSLAVNNNSTTASPGGGQIPAVTGSNGQQFLRPEGGDHDRGSGAGGGAGVFGTLLKITSITILVLMLQKASRQLGSMKWKFAQR
jgi:hypothetical protein